MTTTRKPQGPWKVGALARATGISVRTLHYYEEIGLLTPSARSRADHRLYDRDDLGRLHRILALRHLGFPLEDIGALLDGGDMPAAKIIALQRARVQTQLQDLQLLDERLALLAEQLERDGTADTEALLKTIEVMTMFEKYYSKEQLEELAARREQLGPEGMAAAHNAWAELIARARAAVEAGLDPKSEEARAIEAAWSGLLAQFTGGNPGIQASMQRAYKENPGAYEQFGVTAQVRQFLADVKAAREAS
ncbi:MAG: MerR family transcriptional regulator [Myxococcales bacterium]|nr:MerR family transcriptional regulator [Myxococcales bacterium]